MTAATTATTADLTAHIDAVRSALAAMAEQDDAAAREAVQTTPTHTVNAALARMHQRASNKLLNWMWDKKYSWDRASITSVIPPAWSTVFNAIPSAFVDWNADAEIARANIGIWISVSIANFDVITPEMIAEIAEFGA